ncbi:Gfo/Idh/MocA family oxidoreductase [Mycobacterium avium]|uniref:Gfo/Idh/MocA family protein n=1 Tax=Mycobacterium avium TaxID=1764 RepID=UPI001CD9870C|nr:Gfo/Idh/MocA family oxidoreductase [Mycobacterium avium]MBN3459180.1 Gfo/Idh/MocA family oxidoreductase [Mycobacterium sp. DSM 3803]MCA2239953.1 Gfo/Idh/MocA family oxidoreductase [Mycobacterium avium]MCA2258662.1 Gfo/Idh/MocA family oxidoreductase [Mycobacterium avium]MCA2270372.1 Gfo/Idh/MocA family oxidoreductase [Mycobacterium avium]MCA2280377.1 Gfo/Idh/MocA family oxidoreductase [Mycobacterium avium]
MRPVKIAIVGGGFGSKVAMPVYTELAEFEPVAIWSRRPHRAAELARQGEVPLGTADYNDLLSAPGLEAVHIATPVVTHVPLAVAAAERGLHVLCEKPLADNLISARRLAATVRSAGVVGMCDFSVRMKQTRQRLIERVRDTVGRPRMVSVTLVHSDHAALDSRPYTWVHDARLGGGRLQAYGVHDLDMILEMFPDVAAVAAASEVGVPTRADEYARQRDVTAEDSYAVVLRFRGGGLGIVTLISTAHHKRGEIIEIYGDSGTVRLDSERRLWWARSGEELQSEGPLDASSPAAFTLVARRFAAAIREGATPDPSLDEGLRVQALFDAIRTADVERRWVRPEPIG